jgi:hypothetical protein
MLLKKILMKSSNEEGTIFVTRLQLMKVHALLTENGSSGGSSNTLSLGSGSIISLFNVEPKKKIVAVTNILDNHLTALHNNLKEMTEVRAWVNRAEGSLGEILRANRRIQRCKLYLWSRSYIDKGNLEKCDSFVTSSQLPVPNFSNK